ncbi:hypothetical protein BACUNI_00735, partial [Bacteroides uniformis ATCC 8492]
MDGCIARSPHSLPANMCRKSLSVSVSVIVETSSTDAS